MIKRQQIFCVIAMAMLLWFAGAATSMTALAATKKYKNCTALHKDYKGGVAKIGAKAPSLNNFPIVHSTHDDRNAVCGHAHTS